MSDQQDAPIPARIARAEALRTAGNLDAAEAEIRAVLALMPDSFGALAILGHILRARGDRAAALAQFRAALVVMPRHEGAMLECVAELLAMGRLDEANALVASVLALHPASLGGLAQRGHLARARGDRAAALAAFQAAMEAHPAHQGLPQEAALELAALGRLADAGELYERVPAPARRFDAAVCMGHLARRRGDRAASLAQFERARALQPQHPGVLQELATDLTELGRLSEAEDVLRAVLALDPGNAGVVVRLGHLARRRGDRAGALAQFQAALAITPDSVPLRLEIATELRDSGQMDAARAALQDILALAPDSLPALLQAGHLERMEGNRPAALTAFRHAVAQHPGNPEALVEYAVELRVAGDAAASAALLQQALAAAPGHLHAAMQLAEHAWLADDAPRALDVCRAALEAHPGHHVPYVQMARALAVLGDAEAGLAVLEQGAQRRGPHPEMTAKQLELLRGLGRFDEARALADSHAEGESHFGLWRQRMELMLALGEFGACAAALDSAPAATQHEHAHVWQLRGELAAALWDPAGSEAHLARATQMHPANGWAQWLAARACLLQGDLDGTTRYLRESVRLDTAALRLRGKSQNITQSLLGQIMDEFRIDAALIGELATLARQPPQTRLPRLLALVRANAGHTAPAIFLLIALRQAGLLAGPQAGEPRGIPKRIAQFWDTPEPPDDIAALMADWPARHPDYAYTRFSGASAHDYLRQRYANDVVLAFRRAPEPALKADIFRLAWLYAEGGVYADADDRCLHPVSVLIGGDAIFAAYQEEYGTLGNNFLAACPRHPVIGAALAEAVGAVNRGDQDIPWLSTGPGLLTRAYAATLAQGKLLPLGFLNGSVILERHEMRRAIASHAAAAYKRTGKHWLRAAFPSQPKATA